MALTVTSRGTGTHNTGATTLVPGGRTATLAVGSMGVLCIALDNAGSGGAAIIAPTSWTDAKGNVWTRQQSALYDNGAASAGIEMAIYTAPITTALLTTDLGTMTWQGGASPVAKAWTWYEVIPAAGNTVEYSTGGTIAGATAANAQVVTASVAVGNAVIAAYFAEGVSAVTGDSDTTNGSWGAQQTATIGSTTSGVRIASQQKVQTTTASTQSYDVTVASQDRIAGYIMLAEVSLAKNGGFALSHGHSVTTTGQKAGLGSMAVSHGHTTGFTGKHGALAGFTVSHGHTVNATGKKGGSAAFAVSHGHTVSEPDGDKGGRGSMAVSHPHVVTFDGAAARGGDFDLDHGHSVSASGAKQAGGSFEVTGAPALAFSGQMGHQDQFAVSHGSEVSFVGSGGRSGGWAVEHGHALAFTGSSSEGGVPAFDGEFDLTHGSVTAFTGRKQAAAMFALSHGVALAFSGGPPAAVFTTGFASRATIDLSGSSAEIGTGYVSRSSVEVVEE